MEIAPSLHFSTSYAQILPEVDSGASWFVDGLCHGRVGTLFVILSYLRARDPERILLYIDRGTFVF